jgi:uncharacterized repeat protein (TIGR01451 family)
MSAEKKNDVVTSMKRLYSRGLVLISAIVFGGIAIAQAQKDVANPSSAQSESPEAEVALPNLVPVANRDSELDRPSAFDRSEISLVNAELPELDDAPKAFADDDSAWAESPPVDNLPAELETDDNTDVADKADESDDEEPILPDPVAFPEEVESAPLAKRSNPYRDAGSEPASIDGDDPDQSERDLDGLMHADQIALPEIDRTALPASRYGDPQQSDPQTALPYEEAESSEPIGVSEQSSGVPEADTLSAPRMTAEQGGSPRSSRPAELPSEPNTLSPSLDDLDAAETAAEPEPDTSNPFPRPSVYSDPVDGLTSDDEPLAVDSGEAPSASGAFRSETGHPPVSPSQPPMNYDEGDLSAGGRPGPQSMEGPQSPSLTVQKRAPAEIQVGRPAKFEILVRNTGRVTAENVIIRDEIPAGTNFVDAAPKATRSQDGVVFWEAGSLTPGQEFVVSMELMPTTEGQIGSVATVSFQASASAKTRATKPELVLEHTGPLKALVGDTVPFSIKLTNPGTGAATQVVLEEDVPQGLAHSSGARLEYEVGAVEPGQSRHLELTLKADKAGHVINTLIARADGGLVAEDTVELDVVAPDLQVAIEGPNRRYIERQATFTIAVANPGTAPARNVELVAQLPTGLKFVSTNNSGFYDQSRHAVIWSLEQLPAGEMGKAQFTAMPVEMGSFQIHAQGKAEMGLQARQDHDLSVEGIAALFFGVADKVDPIEVGGQTTYEIKVVNQGSKAASNVQFAAQVPDGLEAVGAQGPTQESLEGQRVMFAPIQNLAPQEQAIFRITVAGQNAGDHRFRVQMTSDETTTPVIKEESTRVYSD